MNQTTHHGEKKGGYRGEDKRRILYRVRIPVEPVVLKNSKQIAVSRKTGKSFVRKNDRVLKAEGKALAFLKGEALRLKSLNRLPLVSERVNLNASIISAGPWTSQSQTRPDSSNLYEFPQDILEAAGIISNDRQIVSHDGSRRVCLCDTCPHREKITRGKNKGKLKPGCPVRKRVPSLTATGRVRTRRKTGKVVTELTACPRAFILVELSPAQAFSLSDDQDGPTGQQQERQGTAGEQQNLFSQQLNSTGQQHQQSGGFHK